MASVSPGSWLEGVWGAGAAGLAVPSGGRGGGPRSSRTRVGGSRQCDVPGVLTVVVAVLGGPHGEPRGRRPAPCAGVGVGAAGWPCAASRRPLRTQVL